MEESLIQPIDDSVPTSMKIGFGAVGMSVATLSGLGLGAAITFFYNVKLGLSEDLVALAWIIFAIWNALNDPLFGILEERTKTKIGRRIPYIRYGAPIFGLTFIFCWFPVFSSTQSGLFWNLLLVLFIFDSTFTMIGLITYTLPAEMCITQKSRAELSTASIIFGAIGMLVSMVVPMVLLTSEDSTELNPAFKPTMVILGIVCSVIMVWGSYHLKENKYAMHEEPLGLIDAIKATFKNKAFLIFEANNFFYQISWSILTGMITYYVQYVLRLSGFAASLPLLIMFAMVFIFIFPSLTLVKKFGLKKMYIWGLLFVSVSFIILFFAGTNIILVYIGLMLIGIGFSPINLTSGPLMHDIIDNDEILSGKRRETSYAGINALITKPSISIANAIFLAIISASGFNKDIVQQTPEAVTGIIFAYSIVPLMFIVISLIAIRYYPLDGIKWTEEKAKLQKVHEMKEKQFLETIEKQ